MNQRATDATAARQVGYRVLGTLLAGLILGIVVTTLVFWAWPDTAADLNAKGLREQTVERLSLKLSEDPGSWLARMTEEFAERTDRARAEAGALASRVKDKVEGWLDKTSPEVEERLAQWGRFDDEGRFALSDSATERLRALLDDGSDTATANMPDWLRRQAQVEHETTKTQFTTYGRRILTGVMILAIVCAALFPLSRWRRPATVVLGMLGSAVCVAVVLMLVTTFSGWMLAALAVPTVVVIVVMAPGDVGIVEGICDAIASFFSTLADFIGGLVPG